MKTQCPWSEIKPNDIIDIEPEIGFKYLNPHKNLRVTTIEGDKVFFEDGVFIYTHYWICLK